MTELSIGEVVDRSGVAEGTLRMWERRHNFPAPERLPSGHRRYSERDVELIRRVAAERAGGVSLTVAIERAERDAAMPVRSIYASLRSARPELEPRTLPKRLILALSRAIEDESLARAERPLLFASFQLERYYRQEQARWCELAEGAELTLAFADFEQLRVSPNAPAEVPVDRGHPLTREWAIVCDAPGYSVCLAGWEPPVSPSAPVQERCFESIWSVEPEIVREAARNCAAIAAVQSPELVAGVRAQLDAEAPAPAREQLRLAAAITNRTLSYLP
jgi:MerR family transcriptional regulator, light-induced transcriptional regulator